MPPSTRLRVQLASSSVLQLGSTGAVMDAVLMGTYGELGWFRRPGRKQKDRARDCLDQVGITELAGRQIGQLSGGQQQRVFLARALAQNADVYFMDEPMAGVDAATEQVIFRLLQDLRDAVKRALGRHYAPRDVVFVDTIPRNPAGKVVRRLLVDG